VKVFHSLCLSAGFARWKKGFSPYIMFEESGWSENDHQEKYRDYGVACCLDILRPGTLAWRRESPNSVHMELASRFSVLFPIAPTGVQRKAMRDYFEGRSDLNQTVRVLEPGRTQYPMKALLLAWQNLELKPKEFFEKLQDQLRQIGVPLSPKPNSYRQQIRRLKKAATDFEGRLGV
jgi:hypothetical protein